MAQYTMRDPKLIIDGLPVLDGESWWRERFFGGPAGGGMTYDVTAYDEIAAIPVAAAVGLAVPALTEVLQVERHLNRAARRRRARDERRRR